jgi:hypothetical protein
VPVAVQVSSWSSWEPMSGGGAGEWPQKCGTSRSTLRDGAVADPAVVILGGGILDFPLSHSAFDPDSRPSRERHVPGSWQAAPVPRDERITWLQDVSPADWIGPRLHDFCVDTGSVVPEGSQLGQR